MRRFLNTIRRRRLKRLLIQLAALFVTFNLIIATFYLLSSQSVQNTRSEKDFNIGRDKEKRIEKYIKKKQDMKVSFRKDKI